MRSRVCCAWSGSLSAVEDQCGRAIWQAAFECFPDVPAMEQRLATESVRYVHAINALTDRLAMPWHRHPAWKGGVAMAATVANEGPAFAEQYPPG